jgi:hypothetical protein
MAGEKSPIALGTDVLTDFTYLFNVEHVPIGKLITTRRLNKNHRRGTMIIKIRYYGVLACSVAISSLMPASAEAQQEALREPVLRKIGRCCRNGSASCRIRQVGTGFRCRFRRRESKLYLGCNPRTLSQRLMDLV